MRWIWRQMPRFTDDDITDAAEGPDGLIYVATRGGALLAVDPSGAARFLGALRRPILALVASRDGAAVCVGAGGLVARFDGRVLAADDVDESAELTGVARGDDGGLCVVGRHDPRTGVVLRQSGEGAPWVRLPHTPGLAGLSAVAALPGGRFLVAGHRGCAGVVERDRVERFATGTEHPLRTACVLAGGRWILGGGGWAQRMPVLLEGEGRVASPLAVAGGERVVVRVATDAAARVWVAENRSDGTGWSGSVLALRGREPVPAGDFPGIRLDGLCCVGRAVCAFGRGGRFFRGEPAR